MPGAREKDEALCYSGRGSTRAEDAQATPTQSHISPSIPVYEEKKKDDLGVGLHPHLAGHRSKESPQSLKN